MKLYFGSTVTAVTTIMLLILVGFIGKSIVNRSNINYWGRRSLFLLAYGLVICCFAAAIIIIAAIATPIAKSQHMRQIWFYVMSGGITMKILVMEIAKMSYDRYQVKGR